MTTRARRTALPPVGVIATAAVAAKLARPLEDAGHRVVSHPELTPAAAEQLERDEIEALIVAANDRGEALAAAAAHASSMLPHVSLLLVTPSLTIREMRGLFAAGTDGVLLDDEVDELLAPAVVATLAGLLAFPRSLRGSMARPVLSTREKQVLGLVVLGLSNREIAGRLHVSESTVKSHLATAFTKLGTRSRREAAALILDPESGLGTGILVIADSS